MLASSTGLDVLEEVVMSEVVDVGLGERQRNVSMGYDGVGTNDGVLVDRVEMNDDEAVVGGVVVVDEVIVDDDGLATSSDNEEMADVRYGGAEKYDHTTLCSGSMTRQALWIRS